MKSHAYSIMAALSLCASLCAEAQPWSLDSCISYATSHNITVKQQEISRLSAEQSVTDAKSRYLPNISAGAGQSWNLGRGLTAENTYADRNTSSFNWNASFSLPLFTGLATERQIAYAKSNLIQVVEQYEAAKEDITVNVISSYLQVLYAKEIAEVATNQVELSQLEFTRREALLEAGKIPEADMLEAKSQLATDEMNLVQANNDVTLALIDLAQLLMLDDDLVNFDITPLSEEAALILPAEEAYKLALQYNHSISAARKGIVSSEKSITMAQCGYLPTLSFSAGLGSSYYKLSGFQNENFGDQMRHNYSTYFSLNLQVPIFDAFNTRNSIRRAKIEKFNAELQLDQAEQQLYRTIQQAYYQAIGAEQKLASSQVAEQAAIKAFESMQEKYNLGRATPSEYQQAKTQALRTTAERIQANYELILRSRLLAFYSTPH